VPALLPVVALLIFGLGSPAAAEGAAIRLSGPSGPGPSDADRARIALQIERLGSEVAALSVSERGLLGEINLLDATARLRAAERASFDARVGELTGQINETSARVTELTARSAWAEAALRGRLRALYRMGALRQYRLVAGASSLEGLLRASRTAAALASADAAVVARARDARRDVQAGRDELDRQRAALLAESEKAAGAQREIERTRAEKERLLASIRRDQQVRTGALDELRRADSALEGLAGDLARAVTAPAMDFSRFQGLLPWPSRGLLRTPFGPTLHPRFQTLVPHDGIDLDAPYGADIRAVFDGKVVYASWLTGYGLTVLIDHGGGYVSVSAHASALIVEPGESVRQGQVVGQVGDTGSLEGALLYFEIRKNGRPVDPRLWLKTR